MIEFDDIHLAFGEQQVLRGLSFTVTPGEILFIIGASGVGKSVTIKHIVGLLQPDRGQVKLDGQRIDHLRERAYYAIRLRCGLVFQHATLFDSLTILDNVALPLRKHKRMSQAEAHAAARAKLELVDMQSFADRLPADLGIGLRKRVAIARTLTLDPEYVLFDEPTTALDPVSARRIDALIVRLKETGVTPVVVSHDLTSTFTIADRITFVYQGQVHMSGTPTEFRQVDDPIVQQFIRGDSAGPMETPGF